MKTLIILLVVLGLGVTSTSGEAAELAPDWALTSAEGELVRLSTEVQEQPVVLFFWASWCPYCKALMPHLQSIRLEYGAAIKILAINFRDSGDPVGFIREHGYDFTLLPNGDAVAGLYDIYGTPGVVIIDKNQQIAFDLRQLPPFERSGDTTKLSHSKKAAYRAPYWAAAIRTSVDVVLRSSEQ